MASSYWVEFTASKVKKAAGDYWSGWTQRSNQHIMDKTVRKMKKKWFFFDDRMETWEEAFDRTYFSFYGDWGDVKGLYWESLAKELYETASKLKPTEIMKLGDDATYIVTYFE